MVSVAVAAESPSLDPSLKLVAPAPSPGEPVTIDIYSAYGEGPFSLRARSPSGNAFEVASGMTDSAGRAELDVYDVAGHRVARLADGLRAAGWHRVAWNGRDESGRLLSLTTQTQMIL